ELRVRHEHLGIEVLAVSLEALVVRDFEHDVHIAPRRAARARVADAAQRHVLSSRDARGNRHRQLALTAHPAFAFTLLAWRCDDLSFAATVRTRSDRHELSEERPLHATHFSGSRAGRARLGFRPGLRAAAIAAVARIQHLDVDLLFDARRH